MNSNIRRYLTLPLLLALPALLGACSLLSAGRTEQPTIYAPTPQIQADPNWPRVSWQLSIVRPETPRMLDTLRIAVRPNGSEIRVYQGANWIATPPEQLVNTLIRTLERDGHVQAVARQGSGIASDYRVLLELHHFEADYQGQAVPLTVIDLNAKLLRVQDQRIIASRDFRQQQQASDAQVSSVVASLEQQLGAISRDIASWVLHTGQADYAARNASTPSATP